jgi:hypothetical protein
LPIWQLARWPHWTQWRKTRPRDAKRLRHLLATGVRESIEEMRLNPFGLDFLGPLPALYPNWEVEKIIYIPLRDLLNPALYARYQLRFEAQPRIAPANTFPCFRYEKGNKAEVLWGATYRITAVFLNYVFGFAPPDLNSLPEIHGSLSKAYLPLA